MNFHNYITQTISVNTIAAGKDFLLILTMNGYMYSYGSNLHGELGLGIRNLNVTEPQLIDGMPEKVMEVHAGLKHALARTSLGRVYSWGWGSKG